MSGYLRRLALRTLRATPTVHSAASLPYATWSRPEHPVFDSPSGIEDPATPGTETDLSPLADRRIESQSGPSPAAFDPPAAPMPSAWAAPGPTGPVGVPADPPPRVDPARVDPGSPLPAHEAWAAPSSPPEVPAERSTPAFDPRRSIPPGHHQGPDWSARDPGPAILVPRRPAAFREDRRPVPAPVDRAAPSVPGAPGVSRAPSRVVADGASTPVGLGPRDRRNWAARSTDEPTEVHVTIGRIELTAVHESPPPKRQAAKVNKPMTLDEYLARRQGRGPSSS